MNLTVIICIMTTLLGPALGKVIMCYFASWATYRPGNGNFQVSDIEPDLCTHYIYAFIGATADGNVNVLDPWNDLPDDGGRNNIGKFVALKKTTTAPKVLAGIGGWNAGSKNFSIIGRSPELRVKFIKNIIAFLKKYDFDGLDMDWDYPAQNGGVDVDKQDFVEDVKEMKAEFSKENLLLTAAFGAAEDLAILSYDIVDLAKILDYLNIMTFDMTAASFSSVVGHHAPMFAAPYQRNNTRLMHNNVKAAIDFWMKSGAPSSKLILGLPLYGRTFTLADVTQNTPGSPSAGPGPPGPYTREAGSIGYNELCEKQLGENWTTVWYKEQQVPYSYKRNQWVGYENAKSLAIKVNFAKKRRLGGIMFWSIDTDDFTGNCGQGRYPLIKASKKALSSTAKLVGEVPKDGQKDVQEDGQKDVQEDGQKDVQKEGQKDVQEDGQKDVQEDGQKDVQKEGQKDVQEDGQKDVQEDGQKDVQEDGQKDVQEDGQKDVQKEGQKNVQEDGQKDVQEDGQKDVQKEGQKDVQEDGQKDGQKDVQKEGQKDVQEDGQKDVQEDEQKDVQKKGQNDVQD